MQSEKVNSASLAANWDIIKLTVTVLRQKSVRVNIRARALKSQHYLQHAISQPIMRQFSREISQNRRHNAELTTQQRDSIVLKCEVGVSTKS